MLTTGEMAFAMQTAAILCMYASLVPSLTYRCAPPHLSPVVSFMMPGADLGPLTEV